MAIRFVTDSASDITLAEAKKLGFQRVILPQSCLSQVKNVSGIELTGVAAVKDAMKVI